MLAILSDYIGLVPMLQHKTRLAHAIIMIPWPTDPNWHYILLWNFLKKKPLIPEMAFVWQQQTIT